MSTTHHPFLPQRRHGIPQLVLVAAAVIAGALVTTGCSSLEPDAAGAVAVSNEFVDAISSGDGPGACELLNDAARESVTENSGKECADAILDLELDLPGPADSAQVYSRAAFVDLGDSALFLTVGPHDWVIRAAGCAPDADRPFDCVIDGS